MFSSIIMTTTMMMITMIMIMIIIIITVLGVSLNKQCIIKGKLTYKFRFQLVREGGRGWLFPEPH